MLCWFLLYNKVNQLYIYVCVCVCICVCVYIYIYKPFPLEPASYPHSIPLGRHSSELSSLVVYSSFPLASCFTHGSVQMSVILSCYIPACANRTQSSSRAFQVWIRKSQGASALPTQYSHLLPGSDLRARLEACDP